MDNREKILEVDNLTAVYKTDAGIVHAVNGVSFSLNKTETIGLVGETGAGKTTTALAIMQLLPERTGRIESGSILYQGEDLLKKSKNEMRMIRGACISMIFQDPMTALNPLLTVGEQIYESLDIHNYDNKSAKELEARVDELLELVGIPAKRKVNYPRIFRRHEAVNRHRHCPGLSAPGADRRRADDGPGCDDPGPGAEPDG